MVREIDILLEMTGKHSKKENIRDFEVSNDNLNELEKIISLLEVPILINNNHMTMIEELIEQSKW